MIVSTRHLYCHFQGLYSNRGIWHLLSHGILTTKITSRIIWYFLRNVVYCCVSRIPVPLLRTWHTHHSKSQLSYNPLSHIDIGRLSRPAPNLIKPATKPYNYTMPLINHCQVSLTPISQEGPVLKLKELETLSRTLLLSPRLTLLLTTHRDNSALSVWQSSCTHFAQINIAWLFSYTQWSCLTVK